MKPPWKFLARLISGRRPSATSGQTIEHDSDPKLIEIALQPASAPVLASPEATSAPEHDHEIRSPDPVERTTADTSKVDAAAPASPTDEAGEPNTRAIDEQEPPAADLPASAPASKPGEPPSIPPGKHSRAARKGRVDRIAQSPVIADAEPVRQSPSATGNPFFDEAASLDEDIKQLKNQLAQKLRLQNAQLREMLKRFERS